MISQSSMDKAAGHWQTDAMCLPYLYPTTAILALSTDLHAFFYLQNPITPVALWAEMLFTHIIMAANKIRHHS